MIKEASLRGYLLEEVLAWLLRSSGFEVLTAQDDQPPGNVLRERNRGLEVRGRGAWHQADALGEFRYVPPFSLPVRLFVEAKYYASSRVDLPTVRNGHGVVHDVNEGVTTTLAWDPSRGRPVTRYRYNYAIFSTSGFTPNALDYALAHQISLIDLSMPDFQGLRHLVKHCAQDLHAALTATPESQRPQIFQLRQYLRAHLLDLEVPDGHLPAPLRVPLDVMAQTLSSRSTLGLILAFPAAPFVLGLASSDLYGFVKYAKAQPTHAVRLRRRGTASPHPVWEVRSAGDPDAYALTFSLPKRVEEWILAQDEGSSSRTRWVKSSMLSTMTLYWMSGDHAHTFQLRYATGELRGAH
ncbi:hypothetical protein ACFYVL_09140 [Streptomyces sp. NPDC004111]|uniref:hypothetical protein n=1 Tax=Streptomyces sp. NPDC004111 TaxID=3364690 RepID=UPI0036CFBAA9